MKRWLSLAVLLAGCTAEVEPKTVDVVTAGKSTPSQPINPQPPKAFDVTLEVIVDPNQGQPIVRGTTNLPVGTNLMVSVKDVAGAGEFYTAQAQCTVAEGGKFEAGPFSSSGSSMRGEYVAEVLMPVPLVQPPEIRAIIGEDGQYLHGPLVTPARVGNDQPVVSADALFTIGSAADIAEQQRTHSARFAKAQALYEQLGELRTELEANSPNSPNDRNWLRFVRSFNQRIYGLQAQIRELEGPNRPQAFLGLAATDLLWVARAKGGERVGDRPESDILKMFNEDINSAKDSLDALKERLEKDSSTPADNDKWRLWTAANGKYSVRAKFLSATGGIAKLEKEDGKAFDVPLDRLCDEDRQFIDNRK